MFRTELSQQPKVKKHWRQRRRGCRGHIPPIFWLGDVNGNIPTNIITYTFGYSNISRPRPMTAFNGVFLFIILLKNPKFATESTQTPLTELTIKKSFKFSTSEFTKIRHFYITKQKICPLSDSSPVGRGCSRWGGEHPSEGNTSSPHPTSFGATSHQL